MAGAYEKYVMNKCHLDSEPHYAGESEVSNKHLLRLHESSSHVVPDVDEVKDRVANEFS